MRGRPETRRRGAGAAFTLIELLVVIVIVLVLLAMLFQGTRLVWQVVRQMQCTTHLKRIGEAFGARTAERRIDQAPESLDVYRWPGLVMPYLEGHQELLTCPEDGTPATIEIERVEGTGPTPLIGLPNLRVWTQSTRPPYAGWQGFLYWNDIDPNVEGSAGLNAKVRKVYGDGFEIGFEDTSVTGGSGGDYDDLQLRFTYSGSRLEISYVGLGTAHFGFWICEPDSATRLTKRMGYQAEAAIGEVVYKERVATIGGGTEGKPGFSGSSSYGVNHRAADFWPLAARTILALDYEGIVANGPTEEFPDVWEGDGWVRPDGTYWHARHFGRCNVLFGDGSVRRMDPDTIDPGNPSFVNAYWDPSVK